MDKMYEILVVGAGISGCVLAERYANVLGKKVLVLEKRNHIGGNCYDFVNDDGILVPLYGPHFFHTNDEGVWKYVSQFTQWHPYEHRVLAFVDGKLVPVPVNRTTINVLFGTNLSNDESVKKWLDEHVEPIASPSNSEESALARVGRELYEKIFRNYTRKQWDVWPSELDASVMNRIPVRTNNDDRYFTDSFQAMPKDGYTKLFERMLANPSIEVRTSCDYFAFKDTPPGIEKVFFTGPIDHYFASLGLPSLDYRSLRFEFETLAKEKFQPVAQVNYPNDYDYTRISEPKHATGQVSDKTTIIREYPTWDGEPYYPVPTQRNRDLYEQYRKEAENKAREGVYFVGRLANYKYFNMDQAFRNALDLFAQLESNAAY